MKAKTILCSLFLASLSTSAITVDFDDLNVPEGGFYKGADGAGCFVSQGVTFVTNYDSIYDSWDGIAYSDLGYKTPTASDYADQFYVALPPDAILPAVVIFNTYAVGYYSSYNGAIPTILLPDGLDCPASVLVNNSAYTWASMTYGDGFARQFAAGDWLKLTITGYDGTDTATADVTGTVDFYLADLRDADPANHYILASFYNVDLTPLGTNVKTITFSFSSSDTGEWGMNTPSYFVFDNFEAYGAYLWGNPDAWDQTWYGNVYAFKNGEGWMFSDENMCYQYAIGTTDGMWVYDRELGWSWTAHDVYPYVYFENYSMWGYFYAGHSETDRWYCLWNDALSGALPDYPYATAAEISALNN